LPGLLFKNNSAIFLLHRAELYLPQLGHGTSSTSTPSHQTNHHSKDYLAHTAFILALSQLEDNLGPVYASHYPATAFLFPVGSRCLHVIIKMFYRKVAWPLHSE
jgi:hypothetical protein